jgi:hypothetical protein
LREALARSTVTMFDKMAGPDFMAISLLRA